MSTKPESSAATRFDKRSIAQAWQVHCDPSLAFDCPSLSALLEIWTAHRKGRAMPMRQDFSPRALGGAHLRNVCFVECEDSAARRADYRFRFFGSGLASYTGDGTGKLMSDFIPPAFLDSWYATFDLAIEMATPLRFVSQFEAFNLEFLNAESLLAPLADASGNAAGLLVSVHYSPRTR